ncbi:MAG: hypothetical protein R2877_02235 [Bdellovibrionota bacterium]
MSVTGMADRLKSNQRAVQSKPKKWQMRTTNWATSTPKWADASAADAYENALLVKPKQLDLQLKLARSLGNAGKYKPIDRNLPSACHHS